MDKLQSICFLLITLAPSLCSASIPNVTACCISKGVRDPCVTACSTKIDLETLTAIPDYLQCVMDIDKILGCAADGRNHTQCCSGSGVPDACLGFCAGKIPSPFDEASMNCFDHLSDITGCMDKGHASIPSAPQNVKARVEMDSGSSGLVMKVSWDPPDLLADNVKYYLVVYSFDKDHKQLRVSAGERQTQVVVDKAASYTVYIVAGSDAGTSHGSETILVSFTDKRGAPVTSTPKSTDDADLQKCCEDSGITRTNPCLQVCSWNVNFDDIMAGLAQPLECIDEIPTIMKCATGGKDHSECCVKKRIPSDCYAFCDGTKEITLDNDHLKCLTYTEEILGCLKQNRGLSPFPPFSFTAKSYKDSNGKTGILVTWELPIKTDNVDVYIVDAYIQTSARSAYHSQKAFKTEKKMMIYVINSGIYTVTIRSSNKYGNSTALSTKVSIQVPAGQKPGDPNNPQTLVGSGSQTSRVTKGLAPGALAGIAVVVLLVIGAIIATAVICHRKQWYKKYAGGEQEAGAVAFENPGYGNSNQGTETTVKTQGHFNMNHDYTPTTHVAPPTGYEQGTANNMSIPPTTTTKSESTPDQPQPRTVTLDDGAYEKLGEKRVPNNDPHYETVASAPQSTECQDTDPAMLGQIYATITPHSDVNV